MGLLDSLCQEPAAFNLWIAARTDGLAGSGTAQDPCNGATREEPALEISLSYLNEAPQEARANTAPLAHGFVNGDVVTISGVSGPFSALWNGTFGIYGVSELGFRYFMKKALPPDQPIPGEPKGARLTFPFDGVMRKAPSNTRIQLGPGLFQTRGFASNDSRGWQPKSGQKVVGAGVDVTTLQLVGAENTDQHYHVIGMPIEPSGTIPIVPLAHFEVSDLTFDCNVDNQPVRLDRHPPINVSTLSRTDRTATAAVTPGHALQDGDFVAIAGATGADAGLWNGLFKIGNVQADSFQYTMSNVPPTSPASGTITATRVIPYANVACGAMRVFGHHSRVSRVKAINWGTKSLRQGCFVISIIQASGRPEDPDGNPIITEKDYCGIEDRILVDPSRFSARESTVLHIGGLKNSGNHAQGFGRGPFIRRNFVDCQFHSTPNPDAVPPIPSVPYSSAFITSKSGTTINSVTNVGIFIGKRPHFRNNIVDDETFARFYNPRDPASRWNGYFKLTPVLGTTDQLAVTLGRAPVGSTDDSSLVVMGAEIRAIAMSSCVAGLVEDNQIHNCWIGGPYQSILDDSVTDPTVPPTLAREEHLDPLNALNPRELVVRNNVYRNVAAGPYWNMGGLSGAVTLQSLTYDPQTGRVTATTAPKHRLWRGARMFIEGTSDTRYGGLQRIIRVTDTTFQYALAPNLAAMNEDTGTYRVVSGVDFLVVEGNLIELADLDETEFAVKEYPLAASPALQTYRACGIVIGDNGLSAKGGPYVHGLVIIRHNKLRYPDGLTASVQTGIGRPAGSGVQITGARQVHLTGNGLNLNAPNPARTFRCGAVYVFNNQRPGGPVVPVWNGDMNGHYDEPETVAEDAFVLAFMSKK